MADHQHVQVFFSSIYRKRFCWIGRCREDIGIHGDLNNIRSVSTAGSFRVKSMDYTTIYRSNSIFQETGLIQCVGMDRNLYIVFISNFQCRINCCRSRSPIFMDFHAQCTSFNLFFDRFSGRYVTFSEKTNIDRKVFKSFKHTLDIPLS
ncbi:hypothetical protein D3C72_1585320 [compost metagenome]